MIDDGSGEVSSLDVDRLCDTILQSETYDPAQAAQILLQALPFRGLSWIKLGNATLALLEKDERFSAFLHSAWSNNREVLDHGFESGELIKAVTSPLFLAYIESGPILDLRVEYMLTFVRSKLLYLVKTHPTDAGIGELHLAAALACNAFLTDYIWFESAGETLDIDVLSNNVAYMTPGEVSPLVTCVIASYRPLYKQRWCETVKSTHWYGKEGPWRAVISLQIEQPEHENLIANDLPVLTDISNDVSLTVKAQYESYPYPRWNGVLRQSPCSLKDYLAQLGISLNVEGLNGKLELDVLVAGCGTGLSTIRIAMCLVSANILALDLSKTSLCFAQRKTRAMGYENVCFGQGDILALESLDRQFDFIECGGVLHHMADPMAGLRALTNVCRPGGLMRIALYSKKARKTLEAVGPFIRGRAVDDSPKELRKARHHYIEYCRDRSVPEVTLRDISTSTDFFNLSMFHDLVFNVQEVGFDITDVFDSVKKLGLRFAGFVDFDGSLMEDYKRFAPNDPLGLEPISWARFESKNPRTFKAMYDFVLQKPD